MKKLYLILALLFFSPVVNTGINENAKINDN